MVRKALYMLLEATGLTLWVYLGLFLANKLGLHLGW